MTIIKIEPNELGGHENNTCETGVIDVPEGWAVVPEDMEIPETFPFVGVEVDETQTPPVVTSMTPGAVPEPDPAPPPQPDEITMLASIAFVTLAELGSIDDVTAGEHAEVFSPWEPRVHYKAGSIRRFGDGLYRCVQDHTSQEDWTPDTAASLWARISDPAEEWPEWSRPVGAHDAYRKGDKVSHNGKHWTSDVDGNVWEPGVYGWTEAE